jgi:hypothetical protein
MAATQSSETSVEAAPAAASSEIHKGFRVSIGTSNPDFRMDYEMTTDLPGYEKLSDDNVTNVAGTNISIGYQKIAPKAWGYSALVNRTNVSNSGGTIQYVGLEGNATYGITEKAYTTFGLNLGKFSNDNEPESDSENEYIKMEDFNTAVGVQAAIGYQIMKNLSAELKYITKTSTYEDSITTSSYKADRRLEITLSGIELGITGTF